MVPTHRSRFITMHSKMKTMQNSTKTPSAMPPALEQIIISGVDDLQLSFIVVPSILDQTAAPARYSPAQSRSRKQLIYLARGRK